MHSRIQQQFAAEQALEAVIDSHSKEVTLLEVLDALEHAKRSILLGNQSLLEEGHPLARDIFQCVKEDPNALGLIEAVKLSKWFSTVMPDVLDVFRNMPPQSKDGN